MIGPNRIDAERGMMTRGRTIMFIDNSNIFRNLNLVGSDFRIDYKRFHMAMEKEGPIWETHFFATEAIDEDYAREKQNDFYNFLRLSLGYNVHTVRLKTREVRCQNCGMNWLSHVEKGIDVWLASKMLILLSRQAFDTCVLVSGDGDYLEAVKEVRNMAKKVELVAFRGSYSRELADQVTKIIFIEDIASEIRMEANNRASSFVETI